MRNSFKSAAQIAAYEGRLVGQARKIVRELDKVLEEQAKALKFHKRIEEAPWSPPHPDPVIDLQIDLGNAMRGDRVLLLTPLKIEELVKQLGSISAKCQDHLTQLEMDGTRVIKAHLKKGVNAHLAAFAAVATLRNLTAEGAPGMKDAAENQLRMIELLNKDVSRVLGKSRAVKR